MNDIIVTYPWDMINERRIGARIYMQTLGVWRRMLIPLSLLVPFVIGAFVIHQLTDLNMLRNEVAAAVLLFYLAIICWMIMTRVLLGQVDRLVEQAPHRQGNITWNLSAKGLQGEGPLRPWSHIVDMQHFGGQTVLLFSARLFVVLPDAALPEGVTPEKLREQITRWRA